MFWGHSAGLWNAAFVGVQRIDLGLRSVEQAITGAVTFIQRGDSALRLNPHFHTIALDGVYVRGDNGELRFHQLDRPSWEDVAQVATWTYEKLTRVLVYHGRSLEGLDDLPDALAHISHQTAYCGRQCSSISEAFSLRASQRSV